MIVTTTYDVAGYRVVQHLGVVRGVTVRSRSVIGNIGAGIQSLFGGNITIYTELAEQAREDAFNLMVEHAASAGANAIIGMALRRQRDRRWHHRSAGLWHRRGGRKGVKKSGMTGCGRPFWSAPPDPQECSSIGRAPVSKTGGCRFESCHSCQLSRQLLPPICWLNGLAPADRRLP